MPEVAHDALQEADAIAEVCRAMRRLTQSAPGLEGAD
jgi:hypothetical protein